MAHPQLYAFVLGEPGSVCRADGTWDEPEQQTREKWQWATRRAAQPPQALVSSNADMH